MKPGKINVPILMGVFLMVGVVADLLPYPGLAPGVISNTLNGVLQHQPAAAAHRVTPTEVVGKAW
jgi:hypothetical protein